MGLVKLYTGRSKFFTLFKDSVSTLRLPLYRLGVETSKHRVNPFVGIPQCYSHGLSNERQSVQS